MLYECSNVGCMDAKRGQVFLYEISNFKISNTRLTHVSERIVKLNKRLFMRFRYRVVARRFEIFNIGNAYSYRLGKVKLFFVVQKIKRKTKYESFFL